MIRNMRSTQNINIRCGSAEPVPLTLLPLTLEEKIADLSRQCEYLESLNKRHCKNRFSGKTLSRKNRTENKKKGRDEEKQDYVDTSSRRDSDTSDKSDAGPDASHGGNTSELD